MSASQLYTGERGAEYHMQRANARSDASQRRRAQLFADLASDDLAVLDFGCGTGGVLAATAAARRIGVEINPVSAAEARQRLNEVHSNLADVPDQSVDLVISNHALEHVETPIVVLKEMFRVLRPGGTLRIVVPCESPVLLQQHRRWRPRDIDMHINSWTPLTLGNLVSLCGFHVQKGEVVPDSAGGRLGRKLKDGSNVKAILIRLKALYSGTYHTIVTARRPLGAQNSAG